MRNKKKHEIFPVETIPLPDENRIKQTIIIGQRYIEKNIPAKTPLLRLFSEQVKYISPPLWATQFLALVIILAFSFSIEPNLLMAQSILFQISPLAALIAVPELTKDSLYNMSELESSCKNSGSIVLLMRLIAIGGINIIILLLLACTLAATWGYSLFSLIMYVLVPYNCVNIVCLGFMQLLKIKGRNPALAVSLLSAAVIFTLPTTMVVANISAFLMAAIFIVTTVVLAAQILMLFRSAKGGDITWNYQ